MAASKVRPFFGYYGGKWRDAVKNYPRPQLGTIIEPFAGSAGYALRYYDLNIILCEIDPVVFGVWDYLIRVRPAEIRAIPDLDPEGSVDDLNVCPEAKSLVGFWLNRGVSTPRKKPSRWMRSLIRPGSFWGTRVRETIASQVGLIRHWRVYNRSYEQCPVNIEATWFIDPPYQDAGHHYRHGPEAVNYRDLAAWCRSRQGQVIVCENQGAKWLPFSDVAFAAVKTTRRKRTSKEVSWVRSAAVRAAEGNPGTRELQAAPTGT
jgi:site-specific DNA-adenine methylase